MGVSIEVWRQRIGRFKMPSSKASRGTTIQEVMFSGDGIRIGIGESTFLVIILSVAIGFALLPVRFNFLMTCGDVELNPGPDAPVLTDDVIQLLRDGQHVAAIPGGLCYKHIFQLQNLRKEINCSWATVVTWLKDLLPDFPSEGDHWPRNIQYQWEKKILHLRSTHLKTRTKHPERLQELEETRYSLPTVKGPRPKSATKPAMTRFEADIITETNEKLEKECKELKHENEELKLRPSPHKQNVGQRREERHASQITQLRGSVREEAKEKDKLQEKVGKFKAGKRRVSGELKKMKVKHARLEGDIETEKDSYVFGLENENVELTQKVNDLEEELKQVKEVNAVLLDAAILWRSKLAVERCEELTLLQKGAFTSNTRKCVYDLLGCHVAHEKIPQVIKSVLDLAEIKIDRLPSSSSIANMNKEMMVISQTQLKDLASAGNLSLQSDETPKFGECFETFIANDDDANSYLVGMRHMADKSAQTTFDTLTEILGDITDTCKSLTGKDNIGHKLLTKITSTMTDRAATETKFHSLVDTYRRECLPLYYEGWSEMGETARTQAMKIYQFFCGLHLMVGMADHVNASLKSMEELHEDSNMEDFSEIQNLEKSDTDLSQKTSESNVVRCVRLVCKTLARGGDAKSGKQKEWRTHCNSINKPEFVSLLQTFKGNRFNIIFLLGGNVFYLYEHILACLEQVGDPNKLVRVCTNLVKNKFNRAGCSALHPALLNLFLTKFVNWNSTEIHNDAIVAINGIKRTYT